jgi:hypothetical protein
MSFLLFKSSKTKPPQELIKHLREIYLKLDALSLERRAFVCQQQLSHPQNQPSPAQPTTEGDSGDPRNERSPSIGSSPALYNDTTRENSISYRLYYMRNILTSVPSSSPSMDAEHKKAWDKTLDELAKDITTLKSSLVPDASGKSPYALLLTFHLFFCYKREINRMLMLLYN